MTTPQPDNRSTARRTLDEQIAAADPLKVPTLSADAATSPVESHLARHPAASDEDRRLTVTEASEQLEQIRLQADAIQKKWSRSSTLVPVACVVIMLLAGVIALILVRLLFP